MVGVMKAYTGGCACGQMRYEASGEPRYQFHCRCRRCRRIAGTGHGSWLIFARADVALTGSHDQWVYEADSGSFVSRGFCPVCGTHVFGRTSGHPDNFVASAGSLDAPERFAPTMVLFSGEGPDWDAVASDLELMPKGA